MPNAQVVADRFHVMIQINQELDQAIKSEKYQANKDYKAAKNKKKFGAKNSGFTKQQISAVKK